MIKSKDKTSISNRQASSFAESEAALGITFEKNNSTKRFAPYSFLSSVDFNGPGQLIFRYTFGTITVNGHALEPLWIAVCRGRLMNVIEQADEPEAVTGIPLIQAIVIRDEDLREENFPIPSDS